MSAAISLESRRGAIRLDDVSVAYGRHAALRHVSGVFEPGAMTAVAGPNGAGKSTLLKALMGELPLAGGRIDRGGLDIADFGYLPQAVDVDRQFPISVADVVLLGAWKATGPVRGVTPALAGSAREALARVGLAGFERRPVGALSVGQFQRALFARLLLQDARILLLDEPFAAVDAATTHDLLKIVRRWHEDGRTVVAVLHDLEQARRFFPQTLLLAREIVSWGPTQSALAPENLARALAGAGRCGGDDAHDASHGALDGPFPGGDGGR